MKLYFPHIFPPYAPGSLLFHLPTRRHPTIPSLGHVAPPPFSPRSLPHITHIRLFVHPCFQNEDALERSGLLGAHDAETPESSNK